MESHKRYPTYVCVCVCVCVCVDVYTCVYILCIVYVVLYTYMCIQFAGEQRGRCEYERTKTIYRWRFGTRDILRRYSLCWMCVFFILGYNDFFGSPCTLAACIAATCHRNLSPTVFIILSSASFAFSLEKSKSFPDNNGAFRETTKPASSHRSH